MQMLQVFDSWAGELSPTSFKTFSLPYLTYIADNVPKRLAELELEPVPMTVFAKGAWYALEDLCKTNYNVVGLDWLHDPAEAYKIARSYGKTVQGNADPGVLYGGREAITAVVKEMVAGFGEGKQGWIANLGHGMLHTIGQLRRLTMTRHHTLRQARRPEVFLRGNSQVHHVRSNSGRRKFRGAFGAGYGDTWRVDQESAPRNIMYIRCARF
jgi:uroporphyrinogen-III decarboxylase